jgi:type I restriction enzyme M protein
MENKAGPLYRRSDIVSWLDSRGKATRNAPLGIEAELWSLSDQLRGSVDASRYRHLVLGLLHLRHATSDEATSQGTRPPAAARWRQLMQRVATEPAGRVIDETISRLAAANPTLADVLTADYAGSGVDDRRLRAILEVIDRLTLHAGTGFRDLLGRTYEYFLSRFASLEGRSGGEFYTPSCVVRLLVEMVEPLDGTVYDPCCGSGGMFVQSGRFIEAHGGRMTGTRLMGQESNAATWRLAHMNLALHGLGGDLGPRPADTLHEDLHAGRKADFILANPPFNMSDWGVERLEKDARWSLGTPPGANANYAWLQHIVHHLAPGGRAGVVLANGSLNSDQAAEASIRKGLVEGGLVECMVALPSQLFYSTSIPVTLWFLAGRSPRKTTRPPPILMIDAQSLGKKVTRTHRALGDEEIDRIAARYRLWKRSPEAKGLLEEGFSRAVSVDEVRDAGFSLSPARYVVRQARESHRASFPEAARELAEAIRKARAVDEAILKAIGE